jgi:3-dehydroquinate synthase
MPEILASTASGDYQILIQQKSLDRLGEIAVQACRGRRAVIVTDENVARLYLERAVQAMRGSGFEVFSTVVAAGEASKSLSSLSHLYEKFHEAGLSRTDPVIALGGGVVGDLAGFAAATYLRGLPLIQVPTTLLAQVDSSIGGKTGIDLPYGKNLAGAFYQPKAVIMDPGLLHSLPRAQMAEGMAEVIKYGLISDLALFEQIEKKTFDLEWILERCIRIKTTVVSRDEKDSGERMLLNFGHTIGHAVEKASGYSGFTHGEAVAVGMVAAADIGERLALTEIGTSGRIRALLTDYHLPTAAPLPADDLLSAIRSDKKRLAGRIYFVLLKKIGEAFLMPMDPNQLETVLHEVWVRG